MKRWWIIIALSVIISAQWAPLGSVAELDDAGAILVNPAGLGVERNFNSRLLLPVNYNQMNQEDQDFSWTMHAGNSGFGYTHRAVGYDLFHFGSGQYLEYGSYFGLMSHVSTRGYEAVDLGLMFRGTDWLSIGTGWKNIYSRDDLPRVVRTGIALRQLGDRLTICYDHTLSFQSGEDTGDLGGNLQLKAELMPGVDLITGYATDDQSIALGINFSLGNGGLENYSRIDKNGELADAGVVGFSTNLDRKRTLIKSGKSQVVELRFKSGIQESPDAKVFFGRHKTTLRQAIHQVYALADDPNVAALIIHPKGLMMGFAMQMELREALVHLQAKGKRIFVFADILTDATYPLVALADGIYLNEGGVILVDGLALSATFWKGTLDKLGIEAQYFRRGKYKSAAETYTRESMSEPSREARWAVLEDINQEYRTMLLDRHGMTDSSLTAVLDRAIFTADQALEAGLIDGLMHPDQTDEILEEHLGEEIEIISLKKWRRRWEYVWEPGLRPQIALIYAEGMIVPGKSESSPFGGQKRIGSVTTSRAIKEAREDEQVKAIVLRINSPGGSVLASEDIWREVSLTTNPDSTTEGQRKPVFVSMGSLAASGGYYIACAADTIVADPACITGSIGVLSGKLSLGGLFDKIGYNVDVLKTDPHADMLSMHRSFTDDESQRMQSLVDNWYEKFLRRVADGRDMTMAAVDSVAQGRIWTGKDAREIGLVDELGGLRKTLELAKTRIGLDRDTRVRLKVFPTVEKAEFNFTRESASVLFDEMEKLDPDMNPGMILDRIALLNSEPALFLMEEYLDFVNPH